MKGWPVRLLLGGAVVAVVALVAVAAFGPAVLRSAIGAAGRGAGYGIAYDRIERRDGHITIVRPDVTGVAGAPLFTAQSIDVAFSLGDVLGSPYLFGIHGIEIDRPKLTIVRYKDGTYNFALPKNNGQNNNKPFTIPKIRLAIKDGSIGIIDETRIFEHSRHIAIEDVQLAADVDPRRRSHAVAGFTLLEEGGKFPFSAVSTFDEERGYELSRLTAKTLAVAPLLDFALNSTTLHIAGGVLNDLDARFYGFSGKGGTMQRHLSASANLDHFQPYLAGLAKPLRDGRGSVRVYDDGLTIPKADGSIADVPVRIAGAIFNLTKPQLRLGIVGRGELRDLITISDAAKKLPIAGPIAFELLVQGEATQPTTLARFSSPAVTYQQIPLEAPSGLVALHGTSTTILHAGTSYGGIGVTARGNVIAQKHTDFDLVADLDAPAQRIPYLAQNLGAMTIAGTVVAAGTDAKLAAAGVFDGANATQHLAGTLALDGRGEGTIGPITLDGPGGRALYARVALDRPRFSGGAAFVALHRLAVTTLGEPPALPGLTLAKAPPIEGTLDANLAGAFSGKRFTLGGDAHAYDAVALGYPIEDLTLRGNVRDGARIAAQARYRGSLAALARASGGKIAATGRVDLPIGIVAAGVTSAIAQISGARFENASVAGIAIDALEGTVGIRGKAIDVYAARARVHGEDVVAHGSFGNGGVLDVSASDIDLAALRGTGLPVEAGHVSAVARVGGTLASPLVEGGVAASGVRSSDPKLGALALAAATGLRFAGDTLTLRNGSVLAGPAVGTLDGRVTGLRTDPKNANYAFDAGIAGADIGTFARLFHAPQYPEGVLEADVHVAGRGNAPAVAGRVSVPQGSINGLNYRAASIVLSGTGAALVAGDGHVTVGSTTLDLAGTLSRHAQSLVVRAPYVELSDFDDYFDYGDALGGHGTIDLGLENEPNRVIADGYLQFAQTRFRRYDVGETHLDFGTKGRTIHTDASATEMSGRVTLRGNVELAQTQPLRDALHRTNVSLDTHAHGIDLGVWLPAAEIAAPVLGTFDADATVRGTYPEIAAVGHGALTNGLVDRVAIRTATIDARAAGSRATIAEAVLAIDNFNANATGSISLRQGGPLDLTVNGQTADLGALAKTLTGKTYDVSGSARTVAHVTGTALHPSVDNVLDADQIRLGRYTIPHARAELDATQTRAKLRSAEIDLAAGRLLASGTAPLTSSPFGVGPPEAAVAFDFEAEGVDLHQFDVLLPKGTQSTGALNGVVKLVGTIADPGLSGTLALTGGSFVGPQFKNKLTRGVGVLTFAGTTATLHDASGLVGGGSIAATGRAYVPSLRAPARDLSGSLRLALDNPVFDAPAYLRGRIDGNVTVVRHKASPIDVGGNVVLSSARVPLTAVFNPNAPQPTSSAAPLPVAFALNVDVDRDVRLQGGPIDVGGTGKLHVGGTLATPNAAGELTSVGGGTLTFFRVFRIADGSLVTFNPSDGVIPTLDVNATTTVPNPRTDVALHVTGRATELDVALSSQPPYSREQILGLLVGAQNLGAVSGLQTSQNGTQVNPFQSLAEGQLGTLLTQNVLEPFSSQLGGALGLSNLALNYVPGGSVDLGLSRRLFGNVSVVFAQTFGYPPRQSVGLVAQPNYNTAAQLTFFSQPGANKFAPIQSNTLYSNNQTVTAAEPSNGDQGLSFSLQRKFP